MTTQKTILIASIIIGVAILGYGYMDYSYKTMAIEVKTKQEQADRFAKGVPVLWYNAKNE